MNSQGWYAYRNECLVERYKTESIPDLAMRYGLTISYVREILIDKLGFIPTPRLCTGKGISIYKEKK